MKQWQTFQKSPPVVGVARTVNISRIKSVGAALQRTENVYTCGKVITVYVRCLVVVKITGFHFADYVMNFPASGLKIGLIHGTKMELPTLQVYGP